METRLTDSFQRTIEYVRLSVTDRCDLRCHYCLPEGYRDFQEPAEWLTFDEIERVLRAFAALGVRRVRLTGGEPLTRHGLPELAARLAVLPGVEDLSLSTNAVQLKKFAGALYRAGVRRLNVSLDSLKPDRFAAITGGGRLDKVLDGLMAAKATGFAPIKLNMVALRGVNDDEFEDMVRFCLEHGFTLRLIETMPVGDTGRAATDRYLDLQDVRRRLAEKFELLPATMPGVARRATCAWAAPICASVSSRRCRSTFARPATACAWRPTARFTSASDRTINWNCGRCCAPASRTRS